jgi:peptidylprolyl isomerase
MLTRKKFPLLLAVLALAAAVAGCGSSAASGIVLAPSGGSTADSSTATTSTTATATTTATTASVPTPTSGPLSTEPKVTVPKGAAPKTLQVKDLIKGTGATAKVGSTITVNYVGALYKTGKVFDASWERKQTFTTTLASSAVISGWVKGIPGMKVGGRRELIIPPSEAYGSTATGGIPANSTLIFVIDLLKVS